MKNLYFLLVFCLCSNALSAQTEFGNAQSIVRGFSAPKSIGTADFNGDSFADILTFANDGSRNLIWYPNDGQGNYNNQIVIDGLNWSNRTPELFQLEDIDNDGDIDILFVSDPYISSQSSRVYWLRNDGSGNFSGQIVTSVTSLTITGLAMSDLDDDGDLDIVRSTFISSAFSEDVVWYANDGAGNFGTAQVISTTSHQARGVFIGDINSDEIIDVLSLSQNGLEWYQNDGMGNFGESQFLLNISANSNNGLVIKDFTNDGKPDMIVSSSNSGLGFFRNDGNGSFNFEDIPLSSDKSSGPFAGDFDMDGDFDFVCTFSNSAAIAFFKNDGSGNFTEQLISTEVNGDALLRGVDIDNDGDLDVLCSSSEDDKIAYYKNDGNANFENQKIIAPIINSPRSMFMADINNDGIIDILSASNADKKIVWYSNVGNGNFEELNVISDSATNATFVYAFDLDNDGDQDVLSASSFTNGYLAWYENNGDGNFINARIVSNTPFSEFAYVIDIDKDGDGDIITRDETRKLVWFENDGSANFDIFHSVLDSYVDISDVMFVDIDNDGNLDILGSSAQSNRIAWHRNDGLGNFEAPILIAYVSNLDRALFAKDINGDGNIDILSKRSQRLIWFESNGDGTFSELQYLTDEFISYPQDISAQDLDNDGDNDIIVAATNEIIWFENFNNESFSAENRVSTLAGYNKRIKVIDIDGDNNQDIIVLNPDRNSILWYKNLFDSRVVSLSGSVYWDKNLNSQFDSIDVPFSGVRITLQPEGKISYTNNLGQFSMFVNDTGTHVLTAETPVIYDCIDAVSLSLEQPDSVFSFEFEAFSTIEQDFIFNGETSDCRIVSGLVFEDLNNNGIQDDGEQGLSGIIVNAGSYGYAISQNDGSYNLNVPNGEEVSVEIEFEQTQTLNGFCNSTVINSYTQTFPANDEGYMIAINIGTQDSINFGVHVESRDAYDVGIYTLAFNYGNTPKDTFSAWIDFKSAGITNQNCTLRINHDPLLTMIQADIPVTNQGNDFVEWIFTNGTIPSFYCMNMNWHLDSSAVDGNTLHWEAAINCDNGTDACPENDSIIRDVTIISGGNRQIDAPVELYSMRHEGVMPEMINAHEVLSYVIDFQNPLGTTAYDVTIIDTLPDELDLATISKPFASFPDYDLVISADGVLRAELKGINLADASVDKLNSYGFLQFNITTKDGLIPGTSFTNDATVYFNGIEATKTNSITHIIDNVLPSASCVTSLEVLLDESGTATIDAAMIDDGSTDNAGNPILSINQTDFDCNAVGENQVTLLVEDNTGNQANCATTVMVKDNVAPVITCRDTTVVLEEGATASVDGQALVVDAIDNCATISSYTLSQTDFSIADEGDNAIVLTVSDIANNEATCSVNVKVNVSTNILLSQYGMDATVSPNPFSGFARLQFSQAPTFAYDLKLIDVQGRVVQSHLGLTEQQFLIEQKNLPKGMYLLNVFESNKSKLLKQFQLVIN